MRKTVVFVGGVLLVVALVLLVQFLSGCGPDPVASAPPEPWNATEFHENGMMKPPPFFPEGFNAHTEVEPPPTLQPEIPIRKRN